jgi:hypothetical protein
LVKKLLVKETIVLPGYEKLVAIAYLTDGSILHIRERYSGRELIKYAYHLIRGEEIVRWDNVPHHREISTYPYHRHERDKILESSEMDIGRVLRVIEQAQSF